MKNKLIKIRLFLTLAILSACLLFNTSARPTHAADTGKVFLIGIDSASLNMIKQYIAEGHMPHMANLTEGGLQMNMYRHTVHSPVNWTTIATGMKPVKHQIIDFKSFDGEAEGDLPFTSRQRSAKTFWEIASEEGLSVGIVGWPVSWPAEPVKGFIAAAYEYADTETNTSFPRAFYKDLDYGAYPLSINNYISEAIDQAKADYPQIGATFTHFKVKQEEYDNIKDPLWHFLNDDIAVKISKKLYPLYKPDIFAVYFESPHLIGHAIGADLDYVRKENEALYGDVFQNYFRYLDRAIGDLLEMLEEDTTVIIVSDRGIDDRGKHLEGGFALISGPRINTTGKAVTTLKPEDVVPMILYLVDLPIAENFDGQFNRSIIKRKYLKEHPVKSIEGYGLPADKPVVEQKPVVRKQILDRTRILNRT